MSFERAVAAGREQLDYAGRRFHFAVDVAHLQDVGRLLPLDPFGRSFEHLRPQLKRRLGRIFEARRIFGGRDTVLGWLDTGVVERPSGYHLVTGGPGSGKSALLANWVQDLERREQAVAYHFMNRQYDTAGRDDTLLSLVQQLRYWYGVSGMAGGTAAEFEAEYLELIAAPPPRPLVIVLDGLDEPTDWTVGPQLFPARLPDGLHIVLSARTVGARDWAAELKLTGPRKLELGPLSEAGVAEVVRRSGSLGVAARLVDRAEQRRSGRSVLPARPDRRHPGRAREDAGGAGGAPPWRGRVPAKVVGGHSRFGCARQRTSAGAWS